MARLRIAVVGGGPAGIYAAEALTRHADQEPDLDLAVDVYDRLPTPFGLLRYGVAPDHEKMKASSRALQKTLDHQAVRFFGNVEIGRDLTVEELREHYSAVIYAFGAAAERRLGVPGEDLPGSVSARRFVEWYSGHPDTTVDHFTATARSAVVVGAGNVSLDVARILLKSREQLAATDIPTPVLDVLERSPLAELHMLVRRGPAQVKFTSKELKELGEIEGVDVVVDPADLELSADDEAAVASDKAMVRNVAILREWATRNRTGAPRVLQLHFWTRPTEILGSTTVDAVAVQRTGAEAALLPAELVLSAVGYFGVALDGVPLDEVDGTIPTVDGRVLRDGAVSPGEYAVGWIRRGATGVLGTNRHDAASTVESLVADLAGLPVADGADPLDLLVARGATVVQRDGWAAIDRAELALGESEGRTRAKLATWDDLLKAAENPAP